MQKLSESLTKFEREPLYPKSSVAANETGTVIISLHVSKEGRVFEKRIDKSSGHFLLDSSTASSLSQCEFTPATANDVATAT